MDPVQKHNTIVSDGKGYYAYVTGVFIYQDLSFCFNETVEKEKHPETMWTDYRYKLDSTKIYTKYFAGTGIAYTPFFLVAHGISKLMGWESDGYTPIYHGAIIIASLCYMALTMLFFGKILERYRISHWVKVFVTVLVYFGTNWFYYTTWESSLSHIYSAAFIAMFWYGCMLFLERVSSARALLLGLLLGMIVLIRPVNVLVVLFLPTLFPSWNSFWSFLKERVWTVNRAGLALLACLLVVSVQFVLYKIQIDQWYIYSYSHEKFFFMQPHIFDFLFSIRKGFFVYAPIFIFSLGGLVLWYRSNKFSALWWVFSMVVITYVFSSWHMWWYGGTLGTRVFIEFYIFWSIPLAKLVQWLSGKARLVVLTLLCLLAFNSVLQQYQYRKAILHYDSMTWQNYKDIFLYPIIP